MPFLSISPISTGYGVSPFVQAEDKKEESCAPNAAEQTQAAREPGSQNKLADQEQQQVAELRRRDQEVRAHEAAHVAAGGAYVRGGASFSYQTGPDGRRYAVGGEVSIDTSPVPDNPHATIVKMETVKRSALAPARQSGQDRMVAAKASQEETRARMELMQKARDSSRGGAPVLSAEASEGSNPAPPAKTEGYTAVGAAVPWASSATALVDIFA